MDFLFIHNNYPAQFRVLAHALAQNPSHRVVYLTNRKDPEVYPLAGVEVRRFDLHRQVNPNTHHYLHATEASVLAGQAVLRECAALASSGFSPRFVIYHAGTGVGLYVSQIFPDAKLIGYFEWYFSPENNLMLLGTDEVDSACKAVSSNFLILHDLEACHAAVVPTDWQKKQFPAVYQGKLQVIFDGLDTSFFCPEKVEKPLAFSDIDRGVTIDILPDQLLMSYATRGMEPVRGFPEFMRLLPDLLAKYSSLHVVIAGDDRCAYSYAAPGHDGSWKRSMLAELGSFEGEDRIHFVGSLPYGLYRDLLRRSDLHCYFSRPYVPSWSLFEAVACDARLMVNRGPHTSGLLPDQAACWVDLDSPSSVSNTASMMLDSALLSRGRSRMSSLPPSFNIESAMSGWQQVLRTLLV
jgi:hypothetical protein